MYRVSTHITGRSVSVSPSPAIATMAPSRYTVFQATIWSNEFAAPRAAVELRFGSHNQVGAGAEMLAMDLLPVKSAALTAPLEDLPLVETIGTSVGWKDRQAQTGRSLKAPSVMVDSYGSALKLAMSGRGMALVNQNIARDALARHKIISAAPQMIIGQEGYFLLHRSETALAGAFVAWLRSLVGAGVT
ncbi:hypothetical protein KMP13_10130 [Epibacterium ulvae]|uniref:hypothetical protein n=1 Tax=Epibacterium ulvae TaxID=1156985 RepID=UPI001BFBF887|nr:hypothetical protein [Epibacterium ulvae]MBT8154248.1 hypothetical protein [Epibacterium ulvae]